jgi:hypothetical protein
MKMSEAVFKQTMSRQQALKTAQNKGDWLWNIVFYNKPLTELKLMYIEYVLLEMETTAAPSLFQKLQKKESVKSFVKKLRVIVDGTTGGVALVTDMPLIEEKCFTEEDWVQTSSFVEEEAVRKAKMLAHKISHRVLGGMHTAEVTEYKSVYRPYWVAFYGEVKEGNRVRYITIPADGGKNSRAR